MAAGCYQDCNSLSMWCLGHLDKLDDNNCGTCDECNKFGDFSRLFLCTVCGLHYHADCLDPPLNLPESSNEQTMSIAIANLRAGWQCPECKTCQVCQKPSDDAGMLCCDSCDSGFHIYCLRPPMSVVPRAPWKCLQCRQCIECKGHLPGSRSDSRWRQHYTLCDDCFRRGSPSRKGADFLLCSVCQLPGKGKTIHHCAHCQRIVHDDCDTVSAPSNNRNGDCSKNIVQDADGDYACPTCRPMIAESTNTENSRKVTEEKTKETRPPSAAASASSAPTPTPPVSLPSQSQKKLPAARKQAGKKVPPSQSNNRKGNSKCRQKNSSNSNSNGGKDRARQRQQQMVRRRRQRGGEVPSGEPNNTNNRYSETITSGPQDDKDENASTMVIVRRDCRFVLEQDICSSCGSIGAGDADALISCAQCGQAYHVNCAGVRPNKVMLNKGWRCIECTVCEGCGQTADESRLLLCDDCDVSYHIYCLDPPLRDVPRGTWKCSWCVSCHSCGSSTPGVNSQWQAEWTRCGPCHSQLVCPSCEKAYANDDLVLQCQTCDRWLHATCDGMRTEEEVELACSLDYTCLLCRAAGSGGASQVVPNSAELTNSSKNRSSPGFLAQMFKAPDIVIDGVCLSEVGLAQMRRIQLRGAGVGAGSTGKRKTARSSSSQQHHNENSMMSNPPSVAPGTPAHDGDVQHSGATAEGVGRGTKPNRRRVAFRVGIGGFLTRSRPPRKPRIAGGRVPDQTGNGDDQQPPTDSGTPTGDAPEPAQQAPQKQRYIPPSRRQAAASYLLTTYPSYLQDAFFGPSQLTSTSANNFLDDSAMDGAASYSSVPLIDNSEQYQVDYRPPEPEVDHKEKIAKESSDSRSGSSQAVVPVSESCEKPSSPSKFTSSMPPPISPAADDLELLPNDLFDEKTHKEVSRIMNDMKAPVESTNHATGGAGTSTHDNDMFPELDPHFVNMYFDEPDAHPNTHIGASHSSSTTTVSAFGQQTSTTTVEQFSSFQTFSVDHITGNGGASDSSLHQADAASLSGDDAMSGTEGNSKSKLCSQRYEQDEKLGDMATLAPILFANTHHPELKQQFPEWKVRFKQIFKLWRVLKTEDRQSFVQRAVENRSVKKKNASNMAQPIRPSISQQQIASQSQTFMMHSVRILYFFYCYFETILVLGWFRVSTTIWAARSTVFRGCKPKLSSTSTISYS